MSRDPLDYVLPAMLVIVAIGIWLPDRYTSVLLTILLLAFAAYLVATRRRPSR